MTLCDNNLLDFGNIIFAVWHLLIGEICTNSLLIWKITLSKSSYGFDRHISRSKTANLFAVCSQLNHCYCWSLFQMSRRSIILSLRDIGCQKSAGSSSGFERLILIRGSINFNLQYFAKFLPKETIEVDVNDGIDEGMRPTQKVHSYMQLRHCIFSR